MRVLEAWGVSAAADPKGHIGCKYSRGLGRAVPTPTPTPTPTATATAAATSTTAAAAAATTTTAFHCSLRLQLLT